MCRGAEKHCLAVEEQGPVALRRQSRSWRATSWTARRWSAGRGGPSSSIRGSTTRSGSGQRAAGSGRNGGSAVRLMALDMVVSVVTASGHCPRPASVPVSDSPYRSTATGPNIEWPERPYGLAGFRRRRPDRRIRAQPVSLRPPVARSAGVPPAVNRTTSGAGLALALSESTTITQPSPTNGRICTPLQPPTNLARRRRFRLPDHARFPARHPALKSTPSASLTSRPEVSTLGALP